MVEEASYWRKCSSCKKPIKFGKPYWVCSVSTCNRKRSTLVFCSVPCWDAHLPIMNHREASTLERIAPLHAESNDSKPSRKPLSRAGTPSSSSNSSAGGPEKDILVVASKVKAYIKEVSGMNTSASALVALSDRLRTLSDAGIGNARSHGRSTVMARDFVANDTSIGDSLGQRSGSDARRGTSSHSSSARPGVIIRRRPETK